MRAVEVIDMVKAPKFFVIAAEQEEPKNPMELKSCMRQGVWAQFSEVQIDDTCDIKTSNQLTTITQIFPVLVHDLSSRGTLDCCSA